jgi:uncharacterized DUF497 family protein
VREDERFIFDGITFEWDADKARSNLRKQQVRFVEGATVFAGEDALMIADPDHSGEESRFALVGMSRMGRILVVVSAERGERFRIISVREAAKTAV